MPVFLFSGKLLCWVLALKYGDTGGRSRPWISGFLVGILFALDYTWMTMWEWRPTLIAFAVYLLAALVLMHIYHRTEGLVLSLLIVAIGTAVLFFGAPLLIMRLG